MKTNASTSMSLGVIDRRTGTVMASVPFPDHNNPHILPPPETFIWHYVRFEHFKKLLENRALHLTRIDLQSDKTDGMYSETNATRLTPETEQLAKASGTIEMENGSDFFLTNSILRRKAFVHCWSARSRECPWMWDTFLGCHSRSVAIRTTIGRLVTAVKDQPVELSRIIYYPRGSPRPDWSYSAPFLAKDKDKFEREREMRLIHTKAIGDETESEFKLIPVSLTAFSKIVVHPVSEQGFVQEVRKELAKHKVHAQVSRSTLRPEDLRQNAKG
jgi:hypothetical protein